MSMPRLFVAVVSGFALLSACAPASAQHRREQDAARQAYKTGQVKSLHEIEGRVLPKMPGADYLGPEFDPSSGIYRLKFMKAGSVTWVDVDGRTGAVVGKSGY